MEEEIASVKFMLQIAESRAEKRQLQSRLQELEKQLANPEPPVIDHSPENGSSDGSSAAENEPSESESEALISDADSPNSEEYTPSSPKKPKPKTTRKRKIDSISKTDRVNSAELPSQVASVDLTTEKVHQAHVDLTFDSESEPEELTITRKKSANEDPDFDIDAEFNGLSGEFLQNATTAESLENEFQSQLDKAQVATLNKAKFKVAKMKVELKKLKQKLERCENEAGKQKLGKDIEKAEKALEDAEWVATMRSAYEVDNTEVDNFADEMAKIRPKKAFKLKKVEISEDSEERERMFICDNDDRTYERRVGHLIHRPLDAFPQKSIKCDGLTVKIPQTAKSAKYNNSSSDIATSDSESEAKFEAAEKVKNMLGWSNLYPYQKEGVKWLWRLHRRQVGGIVGDEMGLGKTVQIAMFLASLHFSQLRMSGATYRGLGPSLIVCPTTLVYQWVAELHKWFPVARVYVMHSSSGSLLIQVDRELKKAFSDLRKRQDKYTTTSTVPPPVIVIITYGKLRSSTTLLDYSWHYAVLDEGHQIRNPEAKVTIAAKQLRTPHRIILSGTPIQNNLKELWCLFDFCYPSLLGTLPVFMEEIATPIQQGGYASASDTQVRLAYKCACTLRETIKDFMIRRTKNGVKHMLQLPDKKDQILFCKLTEPQIRAYHMYHSSEEYSKIMSHQIQSFCGLIALRKICNHSDLYTQRYSSQSGASFGDIERSGKLMVLKSLLKMWHEKHPEIRVLIFTQSVELKRIIVRKLMQDFLDCKYIELDGKVSVKPRQKLVQKFNDDKSYFAMVLTTKVGGLGLNLTGANRVVIFDPDWNPSTDLQAQERSWRIGQTKNVVVYRLLTAGTIEEKIYHRQIQKQFLSTKILNDPRQKRLFTSTSLAQLFELGKMYTETSTVESSKVLESTKAELAKPTALAVSVARARIKFQNRKKVPVVDGAKIEWVAKKQKYVNPDEDQEKTASKTTADGKPVEDDKDADILTSILENANVKTAFDHEKVLKNSMESDYVIVEAEANQKAKAAFGKLKQSQHECIPGIPTFTGSGDNSAAVLLRAIKARNLIQAPSTEEERFMKKMHGHFKELEDKAAVEAVQNWDPELLKNVGMEPPKQNVGLSSNEVVALVKTWINITVEAAFVKASLRMLCYQDEKTRRWRIKSSQLDASYKEPDPTVTMKPNKTDTIILEDGPEIKSESSKKKKKKKKHKKHHTAVKQEATDTLFKV